MIRGLSGVMSLSCIALLVLAGLAGPAHAGRGGHFTGNTASTWDPAIFASMGVLPANVKNLVTDYGATCNGTGTNDATAAASWVTFATGVYPALAVLRIPSGSSCFFGGGVYLTWAYPDLTKGPCNCIIWAYGATVDQPNFGGPTFYNQAGSAAIDPTLTLSARIATVAAGATALTLVNSDFNFNAGVFNPGDWIIVDQNSLAPNGDPPNFEQYEIHMIASCGGTPCSGSTVNIESPLTYSYASTLPLMPRCPGCADFGGPATIHKMSPAWKGITKVYGATIGPTSAQLNMSGRDLAFIDIVCNSALGGSLGPGPTINYLFSNIRTLGFGFEVDKQIVNMTIDRSILDNLTHQSPSPDNLIVSNSTVVTQNGTGRNATITNSTFSHQFVVGPSSYGTGISAKFDGVTISGIGGAGSNRQEPIASYSYNSGTGRLTLSKASNTSNARAMWVPNGKYYTFWNGNVGQAFTATALSEDGSNIYIDTNIVGAMLQCAANPCVTFFSYAALSIAQQNTNINMTQYAAP